VFGYYFHLALRSLRRNIVFTSLMVIAIGVGIGASMTMLTILRAASGDPLPQKSARLFVPQIDTLGPKRNVPPRTEDLLPTWLTYRDVTGLMRAHAAIRQAGMYPTTLTITPPDPSLNPLQVYARATYRDFFPMFAVPFEYGGPWSHADDDRHASVIVLTRALNATLFGGKNSVGKTLTIGDKAYRIIGVLDQWQPSPRFYDLGLGYSGEDQLFLPFTRAIDEHMATYMNLTCDRGVAGKGWDGLLQSDCIWLRFWVELADARDAAKYATFLHNYAADEQQAGRFDWQPRVALRNLTQWLSYNHVVPSTVDTLTGVSFALLLVCVLNAIGLMLANFMTRSGVLSVRRALGATRPAIFAQLMIEAGVVGAVGGLVGIGLTRLGLQSCRIVLPADLSVLMQLHRSDVLIALAVALAATLLAGLYPTWRAMQVQPALQLKTL
jgi:putative ABC transport system permease protein